MKLSNDKRIATIQIDGVLSATEIESLIRELSIVRAAMEPAVPGMRPSLANSANSDVPVLVQNEPSVEAVSLKDGGVRFWLRNQGLGWMAVNFTLQQAITLRDFFVINARDVDTVTPGLFGQENGEGNQRH